MTEENYRWWSCIEFASSSLYLFVTCVDYLQDVPSIVYQRCKPLDIFSRRRYAFLLLISRFHKFFAKKLGKFVDFMRNVELIEINETRIKIRGKNSRSVYEFRESNGIGEICTEAAGAFWRRTDIERNEYQYSRQSIRSHFPAKEEERTGRPICLTNLSHDPIKVHVLIRNVSLMIDAKLCMYTWWLTYRRNG